MKILLTFLIFICVQTISMGQNDSKHECVDSTKYRVITEHGYAELEININEKWESIFILDGASGQVEYECEEMELNGTGTKELVIKWSDASYGSGGGNTIKGVQIWDLDNATKLFDEVTYCSQESFGRQGSPAYLVECHKIIEIIDQKILVGGKVCSTLWSESDDLPDPTSNCPLTSIEEGIYFFHNGILQKE